jgi:hypothetical protein
MKLILLQKPPGELSPSTTGLQAMRFLIGTTIASAEARRPALEIARHGR